jgi:hypothetical protein
MATWSDLGWLMVIWSEIKWRICFAHMLPLLPLRDWKCSASSAWKSVKSVSSVGNKPFSSYEKTLHLRVGRCRAENPRIVKARSSLGISREHEWAGAWQYVSISRAMWERKRERKNVSGKGVVYQNNTLNINLMYSYCLLHISSANSAAIVKRQSFSKVE